MSVSDKYEKIDYSGYDASIQKIIKHQQNTEDEISANQQQMKLQLESKIASSEELLRSIGQKLPNRPTNKSKGTRQVITRSWDEIQHDAEKNVQNKVSISDILPETEISKIEHKHQTIRKSYDLEHTLDELDWGIAGVAGTIAALVDIFMVKIPSSPGFLGGSETQGGVLSDFFRNHLKNIYSPEEIEVLEKKYWVPYDASTSQYLNKYVAGLGPRSHRFHSLGHDPILGFLFGVWDVMHGQFTSIDKTGKLIVQSIPGAPDGIGIFEAIATQIGHLKSDIATPAGLPAPFMPLLQFFQFGDINDRTIGELARAMYGKGYDFGHFLSMGIPVLMIEVIVRILYFTKRMSEGHGFMDSLPLNLPGQPHKPKLQTMLFTAHTIATAANAGKVYFTQNPLSTNLPQWLWYAKTSFSQLKWIAWDKENERLAIVQKEIDTDWQHINDLLVSEWSFINVTT